MKRLPRSTLLAVVVLLAVASATLLGDRFPVLTRLATSLGYSLTDEVQATEVAGFESDDLVGILGPAEVLRVTDGDTLEIELNGQEERVRLIGVDAPELYESRKLELDDEDSPLTQAQIQALGDRARDFTEAFIGGQEVYLEAGYEPRDRYGRLLAYVHVGGTFVNAELVRGGYARTLEIPPNTAEADRLAALERAAGEAGIGLWGAC